MNKEEMLRQDRTRDLRIKRVVRKLIYVGLAFFVLFMAYRERSTVLPLICIVMILGAEIEKLYVRIERLESQNEGAPSPEGAP